MALEDAFAELDGLGDDDDLGAGGGGGADFGVFGAAGGAGSGGGGDVFDEFSLLDAAALQPASEEEPAPPAVGGSPSSRSSPVTALPVVTVPPAAVVGVLPVVAPPAGGALPTVAAPVALPVVALPTVSLPTIHAAAAASLVVPSGAATGAGLSAEGGDAADGAGDEDDAALVQGAFAGLSLDGPKTLSSGLELVLGKAVALHKSEPDPSRTPGRGLLAGTRHASASATAAAASSAAPRHVQFKEEAILVTGQDAGHAVEVREKPSRGLVASVNAYLAGRVTTKVAGSGLMAKKKEEKLWLVLRPDGLFFYRKATKYNYVQPSHGTVFILPRDKLRAVSALAGSADNEWKIELKDGKTHVCTSPEAIATSEWIDACSAYIRGELNGPYET